MSDYFSEAIKFREVARDLFLALGKSASCTCVNTPEYDAYLESLSRLSKNERMVAIIFQPFGGETIASTCERCSAMERYEDLIGPEALDVELAPRIRAIMHSLDSGELDD